MVHPDQPKPLPASARQSVLEIVGQDRPGIVREISHVLAGFGVNVEELQTECASAAMSGETLFKARARLSIPESCNAAEIRQQLEKIAEDLIVEISLAELPEPQRRIRSRLRGNSFRTNPTDGLDLACLAGHGLRTGMSALRKHMLASPSAGTAGRACRWSGRPQARPNAPRKTCRAHRPGQAAR